MPLPIALAPLAWKALQFGGAAAVGALILSRHGPERVDAASEDALDRLPEGRDLRVERGPGRTRVDGEGRWRRTVRFGPAGLGVDVDVAAIGRLRVRRLRPEK